MEPIRIQLDDFDPTELEGFISVEGKPMNAVQVSASLSDAINKAIRAVPKKGSIVFNIATFDNKTKATSFLTSLETRLKTLDKSV